MAKLMVMYKTPKDVAAFDKHYAEKHIPIAKKVPGLKRFEVTQGPIGTPAGPAPYHTIAILHFDNVGAIQAGMMSAEGQAAAADAQGIATGGVDILIFDTRDV